MLMCVRYGEVRYLFGQEDGGGKVVVAVAARSGGGGGGGGRTTRKATDESVPVIRRHSRPSESWHTLTAHDDTQVSAVG